MQVLRIAGLIGGGALVVLGVYAAVWVRFAGDDPNLLVTTVPLIVAGLGLALAVRAIRTRRP